MTAFAWVKGQRIKLPPVQSVTPLQARRALLDVGLLGAVDELVAANPDASLAWEYATEINRNDPLIAMLADQIGMDADQIDALFERAALL